MKTLQSCIAQYLFTEHVEIEARFKVDKSGFYNVLNAFKRSDISELPEVDESDEYRGSLRKRGDQFVYKHVLEKIRVENNCDVSFAKEQPVTSREFYEKELKFVRMKKRISFVHKFWSFDFTIVDGSEYEIEIEIKDLCAARRYPTSYLSESLQMKISDVMKLI